MSDFEDKIKSVDVSKIKDYLDSLKEPCYESQLLKIVFNDMEIVNEDSLTLFQNHFVLFHILYLLQDEYYKENKYLHVHFMRIFLLDYPPVNQCRYYNEHLGKFCCALTEQNNDYCSNHLKQIGDKNIEFQSSKYFYLDKTNYKKFNNETANDLLNGVWEVLSDYDNYKKSFEILGLPESSGMDLIKKQYKYLAKKYHPDINSENEKKFTEINNAYRYLMKKIFFKRS
jgi:hypothetical protein